MACIYCATNLVNGKAYIGKTTGPLQVRRRCHENDASKGSLLVFHRALRKYGFDQFAWTILEIVANAEELGRLEVYYISRLGTMPPRGYNMTPGGDGGGTFNGRKHSEATKQRIRKAWTEELKARVASVHIGRKRTAMTRQRISTAAKGRIAWNKGLKGTYCITPPSEEAIAHMKAAQNRPEVKAKISKALKGRKKPESFKRFISTFWRGRKRGTMSEKDKELRRKIMIRVWKDPEYVTKRTAAHAAAMSSPQHREKNRLLALRRVRDAFGRFAGKEGQ